MQVKKFEARTMKEALEMVKSQLGPDAIILSAKDNAKSFGLVGQGSVEITAAVSEQTLRKKQFVESRLREEDRIKFQASPARVQKRVMEKAVNRYTTQNQPRPANPNARYAEIEDDADTLAEREQDWLNELRRESESRVTTSAKISVPASTAPARSASAPTGRVSSALATAASAISARTSTASAASVPAPVSAEETAELKMLREELVGLKRSIQQMNQQGPAAAMGRHAGADYGLGYEFSSMFEKLNQTGLAPEVAAEILTVAQRSMPPVKFKNKSLIEAWVARYILDNTLVADESSSTRLQVFVGPSGAGKTSTMIKLASHYVVNENKKVALVTTDTSKVGAIDQMRIYAQILNVPFAIIRQSSDWEYISTQLAGFDYILCDTPGMNLKSIEEISWLKSVLPGGNMSFTTHLVLSSMSRDADLQEMGRRYSSIGFKDVIFTALDGSLHHGVIYNFMQRFDCPLHSFGLGTKVPEDFELATRERVLDLLFKLTKIKSKESEL